MFVSSYKTDLSKNKSALPSFLASTTPPPRLVCHVARCDAGRHGLAATTRRPEHLQDTHHASRCRSGPAAVPLLGRCARHRSAQGVGEHRLGAGERWLAPEHSVLPARRVAPLSARHGSGSHLQLPADARVCGALATRGAGLLDHRALKPVEMTAALGSGSAPRPFMPQPWASALPLLLGSGPSPFEATHQPSSGPAEAEDLDPNPNPNPDLDPNPNPNPTRSQVRAHGGLLGRRRRLERADPGRVRGRGRGRGRARVSRPMIARVTLILT